MYIETPGYSILFVSELHHVPIQSPIYSCPRRIRTVQYSLAFHLRISRRSVRWPWLTIYRRIISTFNPHPAITSIWRTYIERWLSSLSMICTLGSNAWRWLLVSKRHYTPCMVHAVEFTRDCQQSKRFSLTIIYFHTPF